MVSLQYPIKKIFNSSLSTRIATLGVASLIFVLASGVVMAMKDGDKSFSPYVDEQGRISLPKDFRLKMVHLGSFFVPEGEASGFHDVYAEAEAVLHYRKNGTFPDGATIVKELRPSQSGDYTTGKNVSHATSDIKQWFVMVKDTKGRFKDNSVWGDGWGWALFKTNDSSVNVSQDYKKDCLGCHAPAKKTDWVYIEGYPTLNKP